uniref:PDZ domain-containing protein n=1 Tax=Amphora coffeiformis TaxID=265554 RepID=A0A7S3P2T1_9STRA|mmetsp:Transcript_1810/g.3500  ORF Transcript_1810/g.3500 Transcript_1810/m.3500 type:complete len:171 (+) Transcript_1810:78-590(+)
MTTMFCVSAIKTSAASPLGIRLWSPPIPNAPVLLVHIDDHGLFAGKFKTGMNITKINETKCKGATAAQVEAYLAQLVGRVTIWACAPPLFSSHSVDATAPTKATACRGQTMTSTPNLADLSESNSTDEEDEDSSSIESADLEDGFPPVYRTNHKIPGHMQLYDEIVSFLF